jgi:hypothetical protein
VVEIPVMTADHATATTYAEWLVETESPATASRANLARAYLELRERVVDGGQRAIDRIDRTLDEMLTTKGIVVSEVKLDVVHPIPTPVEPITITRPEQLSELYGWHINDARAMWEALTRERLVIVPLGEKERTDARADTRMEATLMYGSWNGLVFPTPVKLEWPKSQPDVPEWERRPFADSPREYWLQAYPGTQRARLERAIKEHAEGEKETE